MYEVDTKVVVTKECLVFFSKEGKDIPWDISCFRPNPYYHLITGEYSCSVSFDFVIVAGIETTIPRKFILPDGSEFFNIR